MTGFARLLAVLAIAVGLGAAAILVTRGPGSTGVGGPGSASPSPAAVVSSATAGASATAAPSTSPTPAAPAVAPCTPATLAARITLWEGAAGHRIAHVELTNTAAAPCTLQAVQVPQLVDGNGAVLIQGPPPASPDPILTVGPGGVLKTLVQDGNYCGPAPKAPVSVAFVLANGGRFVATPFSPTDATLPPCNGAGSPADISMQPWAP
jgi:hypothetical protein